MINKKELVPLQKKISTIAEKVTELTIKNEADMKSAVSILSQMNQYKDAVEEKKTLLTKPLNEALKNARALFKGVEEVYSEAIEALRGKMSSYQTELVRIRREEELKIANRVGEGSGKLKIETAVKKIESLKVVEKEVASEEGLVQFRETKVLKVIDPMAIPREYLMIDEKKLLEALKGGKVVTGAEIEVIQVPCNFR